MGVLIVAQVGIAGSVKFEDGVVVGGQAGFAGHLTVGKGAKIAGQAGITKNVDTRSFLERESRATLSFVSENFYLTKKIARAVQ